jgi:hypothetical protein
MRDLPLRQLDAHVDRVARRPPPRCHAVVEHFPRRILNGIGLQASGHVPINGDSQPHSRLQNGPVHFEHIQPHVERIQPPRDGDRKLSRLDDPAVAHIQHVSSRPAAGVATTDAHSQHRIRAANVHVRLQPPHPGCVPSTSR